MKKIELLAPAGDLEKLKIAILYGADAVFLGGEEFSLRARASNFTLEDIKEACDFAHQHNASVHVTSNIIPHNENLEHLIEYLRELDKAGVDAIICASYHIMQTAIKYTNLTVHVSTQQSVTNSKAVEFFEKLGVSRVVLARETTLDEIRKIKENSKIEIEAFIHGGMCSSISGRCMLSNVMTDRDANRGGCAHSCRWNYDLYDSDQKVNQNGYYQMSSKDLQSIRKIPDLIDSGVDSFKIEGRMKSIHYIATVVSNYRKIIDDYQNNGCVDFDYYEREMNKAANRLTSTGFLDGVTTSKQQLYNMRSEEPTKEFVGIVMSYNEETQIAIIEQRNYFLPNDTLEVFGPNQKTTPFLCREIKDIKGNVLDAARHPKQILQIYIPFVVFANDMIRLVK